MSPGTELTVYRVVQESLTNTLKHTEPPTTSEVRLEWASGELALSIVDDGAARNGSAAQVAAAQGRGIRGMRERVEQAGGRFESGPAAHGGWRVAAAFPLSEASDD